MALIPIGNFLVKSPSCDAPPKHGLLASVEPLNVTDHHWFGSGITWEDFLCGSGLEAFIDECPPASGFTKPADRTSNFCSAEPFIAVGSYECSPVGRPANEAFEIARKRLLVWESHQVEETLWTGAVSNGTGTISPSFAFGNPDCDILPEDVSPSGSLDPVSAIAVLEAALGDTVSCGGTIHVPYGLLAYLARFNLLTLVGDKYFTPSGFQVIGGHGYPGSGPDNVAAIPGEIWAFGTGPLVVVRSSVMMVPDQLSEAVDRLVNNITVRSERIYAVGFSCAVLAVRVKICTDC